LWLKTVFGEVLWTDRVGFAPRSCRVPSLWAAVKVVVGKLGYWSEKFAFFLSLSLARPIDVAT
jgi:hypothetical protein